jgi:hypothetical protein
MKTTLVTGMLILLTTAIGCKKDKELRTDQFDLEEEKCTFFERGDDDITFCFNNVVSDNRCPVNAFCITSGTAVADFTFTINNTTHRFNLATLYAPPLYGVPSDTTIAGYKIKFIDLVPYPGEVNTPIVPRAKVKISR